MTEKTQAKKPFETKQPLTAQAVFQLGRSIEYLIRANEGAFVVHDDGAIEKEGIGFILSALKELEYLLRNHGLADTQHHALELFIREFETKYAKPNPPKLDKIGEHQIERTIGGIEAIVVEELAQRNFAELTPLEGILDYKKLLAEGARGLLVKTGREVPQIVINDLEEAIKCLSYGAPTASVMIGLRAVEGMVRELHHIITGKKSTKAWANLIDAVEEDLKSKGEQPPLLLGYLDYIRDVRNKADHPDKVFTLREAEQIFMHVIHTIQEIQKF